MGRIVQLAEARSRKARSREAGQAAAGEPSPALRAFEAVEYGSGWYHGEAIRASKAPSPRPH